MLTLFGQWYGIRVIRIKGAAKRRALLQCMGQQIQPDHPQFGQTISQGTLPDKGGGLQIMVQRGRLTWS